MGSPLSSSIANLVMEDFENKVLNNLNFKPVFYKRYVDDIVALIPKIKIEYFLNEFNKYNERIQFTMEVGEKIIHFLDVTIQNENQQIYNLVDRGIKLTDKRFHEENINLVKNALLNNNYTKNFIKKYIRYRYHKINNNSSNQNEPIDNRKIIVFPYTHNTHEKFSKICHRHNMKAVFETNNNNSGILRTMKDSTHTLQKSEVIYSIPCKDCDSVYIGQTKRKLKRRI